MKALLDFTLGYIARKFIDYLFGKFVSPRLVALVKRHHYTLHYYKQHHGRPSKCHKCKHGSL